MREDRNCVQCKEDIGDERHFLTTCKAIIDEWFGLKQLSEADNF